MLKNRICLIVGAVACVMMVQSCRSRKSVSKMPDENAGVVVESSKDNSVSSEAVVSSAKSPKKIAFSLYDAEIRTLNISNANAKIVADGKTLSSRASIKIVRDSIIQISLQPMMGIEVARMNITPEKVVVVNKLQSRYVETSMDFVAKMLGVQGIDFYDLQALLTDRVFIVGERLSGSREVLKRLPSKIATASGITMSATKNAAGFTHQFVLDNKGRVAQVKIQYKNIATSCSYSDFRNVGQVSFPQQIDVTALHGTQKSGLAFQVKKMEINVPVIISATNVGKLTRVSDPNSLFSK